MRKETVLEEDELYEGKKDIEKLTEENYKLKGNKEKNEG